MSQQINLALRPISPALELAIRREESELRAIETRWVCFPEFVLLAIKRLWDVQECESAFPMWQKETKRRRGGDRKVHAG